MYYYNKLHSFLHGLRHLQISALGIGQLPPDFVGELVRVDAGNLKQCVPLLRADVVLVPGGLRIKIVGFLLI